MSKSRMVRRMQSAKRPNKNGITLVEVLFSAAIITLIMVGVIVIFIQAADLSQRVDFEYAATTLSKNKLERARTLITTGGFSSLTGSNFDETDTVVDSDGVPDANGDFKRTTTVTTSYSGTSVLTRVAVSVVYKYRGTWKTDIAVTATTVFADI